MPFVAPKMAVSQFKSEESFAEIQKTEGKPCRDLDQGEAISTLNEYQGRISIMYAVSRHSAFQAAQRAFRSNRSSHEIGRRNLPQRQILSSICIQTAQNSCTESAKLRLFRAFGDEMMSLFAAG
jgi:hypothetical protein